MKKTILLLSCAIAFNASGMQSNQSKNIFDSISQEQKIFFLCCMGITTFTLWRLLPYLAQTYSSDSVTQKIGFNPLNKQKILKPHEGKTPLLYAQGWPGLRHDSSDDWQFIWRSNFDTQKIGLSNQNIFVVTCTTQDSANMHSANSFHNLLGYRTINLGDTQDAMAIIYALIECHRAGYKQVYGLGLSRGGSSWASALDMLYEPQKHISLWKKLGMVNTKDTLDVGTITELQNMVENGHIFLSNPLLDLDYTLNVSSLGAFVLKWFLALAANYNPFRTQPHILLKNIISKNSNLMVSLDFAKNDPIIGQETKKDMIEFSKSVKNLVVNQDPTIYNQHHNDFTGTFYHARQIMENKKDK